jgi:hypothetical protein
MADHPVASSTSASTVAGMQLAVTPSLGIILIPVVVAFGGGLILATTRRRGSGRRGGR